MSSTAVAGSLWFSHCCTLDCPINLTVMMPNAIVPDHNQHQQAGVPVDSVGGGGVGSPGSGPVGLDAASAAANKKATNVLYYNHHINGTGAGQPPPGTGAIPPQNNNNHGPSTGDSTFNLLRRLANSQFQNYNTALTVTVVVGCFLLLLNVLIFVGIYYQREKRVKEARQKDELVELDCQQYGGGGGVASSSAVVGRSPSQGSEKNGGYSKSGGIEGMTTLSRKGSFQSVRNFNEYRCYDEKNFQQQQLGHQHYGSRHHLHQHSHQGSLNRKYLVDVCHNPNANGSVADLQQQHSHVHHQDNGNVVYGDCRPSSAAMMAMNRELSVSSSHIAGHGGGGGSGVLGVGSNSTLHHQSQQHLHGTHQLQQQQHHLHHHTCQSRRHSMVTEGTQSDPISLKDLEYETNSGMMKKKKGHNKVGGCEAADCRGSDTAIGTQTDNVGDGEELEDVEDPDGEEEEDDDDDEELDDESPGIPEPPPPPRGILTGGILRTTVTTSSSAGTDSPPTSSGTGTTINVSSANNTTPSGTKKRVQIQEISV